MQKRLIKRLLGCHFSETPGNHYEIQQIAFSEDSSVDFHPGVAAMFKTSNPVICKIKCRFLRPRSEEIIAESCSALFA